MQNVFSESEPALRLGIERQKRRIEIADEVPILDERIVRYAVQLHRCGGQKVVVRRRNERIRAAPTERRNRRIKQILLFGVIAQIVDPIAHHNADAFFLLGVVAQKPYVIQLMNIRGGNIATVRRRASHRIEAEAAKEIHACLVHAGIPPIENDDLVFQVFQSLDSGGAMPKL